MQQLIEKLKKKKESFETKISLHREDLLDYVMKILNKQEEYDIAMNEDKDISVYIEESLMLYIDHFYKHISISKNDEEYSLNRNGVDLYWAFRTYYEEQSYLSDIKGIKERVFLHK